MPTLLNRIASSRSTVSKEHKCTVQLLDDSQTISVEFKKDAVGQVVLDYVCDMLNVAERDYFGLRYVDSNRHRYWLDTSKPILRQVKSGAPIIFAFRVKYYPIDPSLLHEQLTRYLVTLQLKRDLLHGRLYCPQNDAAVLGAYIIQAELGDYDANVHKGDYVSQFKMFLNQTPRLEERIAIEHQKLKGMEITPSDADSEFLKKASALDTYGYYPFSVKDAKNGQVYVGATPRGLLIYQAHKKLHYLKWADIKGFDYSGKEFFIFTTDAYFDEHASPEEVTPESEQISASGAGRASEDIAEGALRINGHAQINPPKPSGKKKACLRYICPSAAFCKHLWKKDKSEEAKPIVVRRGPIFRRSTFRYTGRVLQEIKESTSPKRPEPAFERAHAQRQLPREERSAPWTNKFHTLPRAMKSVPEDRSLEDVLNHTAPNTLNVTRDSLLLETTSQATPITTPMSGSSPLAENGPWTTTKIGNGPSETSYSVVQTTTSTTCAGPTGYQSEVITETQRRTITVTESGAVKSSAENGSVIDGTSQQPYVNRSGSTSEHAQTDQSSFLTGLLFVILIIITVVMVMEVQDADFRRYLRRVTGDDAFRRHVYDPVRQRVADVYGRVFK